MLKLEMLNGKNVWEILKLSVDEGQRNFVASNDVSIIEDCAIVTHGFFMHTLIGIMKNVGFKADKERVNYRNGEVILLTRKC